MDEEAPFRPRWTWRALRKEWRARGRGPAESPLVVLALAASLLCFLRTFALLGGGSKAGVVAGGMEASVWMVLACLLFGLAGALVGRTWTPRVPLRRASAPSLDLRGPDPGVAALPAAPVVAARPTHADVIAAIAGARAAGLAWLTPRDAIAASALVALFGAAQASAEPAKASKPAPASLAA